MNIACSVLKVPRGQPHVGWMLVSEAQHGAFTTGLIDEAATRPDVELIGVDRMYRGT
jgi:hypothetical protein